MKHVLVVKTSSMGDVLHTLPALTDAANILTDIRFDWVVEEGFSQIPGWHPAVDLVIPVAIRRWRKNWLSASIRQEREQFYQQLRVRKYDAVIDAQSLIKSAVFVTRKALGIKHGLDWFSAREPLASLFYSVRHHVDKNQHAVERIRQLFAQSLQYQLPVLRGDYSIASYFQQSSDHSTTPYVVFLHATTRMNKHWPEEYWRELIQRILETNKIVQIKLPWGAVHEYERAQRLASGLERVTVLPKLSLTEIAHCLAKAEAIVSVDTGLSHLAAALAKPNITLYGPTDPGLIGGYGDNQQSIISTNKTMEQITVDQVYSRLLTILQDKIN